MALTIATDLTNLTTAETAASPPWFSIGAQSAALEPDFFAQGANSVSRAVSNAVKGMVFDNTTGLNFTTTHAGKLVYIWMRSNTPSLSATRASGGIVVRLCTTSATADYREWYVDGSDTLQANDGWKCYVIDPTSAGSVTTGSYSAASVRYFGGTMNAITTAKGQNFGIDRISYGFGTLLVKGTVTTAGAGFKEIADWDWGDVTNGRFGVLTVKDNINFVQGRIQLGDNIGSIGLTFTSQGESVVWQRPTYYDGTREVDSVPDARPDGTPYFGIVRVGNGSANTDVTIGAKVGTGDTASGRSGGSFIGSRIRTGFLGKSGAVGGTLKVYGANFQKFWGGIDLTGNTNSEEWMGGSTNQCGTFDSGSVVTRNVSFIDNLGGTYTFYDDLVNDGIASEALATADPRTDWANAVGGTQLVVPAGVNYVHLTAASTTRNVVKINSDKVGSDDHYVDAIVRFPTGSNQGVVGIIIRASTTLATENYWFLQCDRPNSQISLVRCDTGTDTTVAGPTAFTFAADTDYQIHLRGSGTTIEGFVNGTKVSTTSSTYQTNRWVGIRGTTNTSQSASAEPRILRFGCGPTTNVFGAARLTSDTAADIINCNFINNGRATSIAATGISYTYDGFTFSGNGVGIRNASGGAVTVAVTNGDAPETTYENLGSGTTTVVANVNVTITIQDQAGEPIPGVEVAIFQDTAARTVVLASTPTDEVGEINTTAAQNLGPIIIRARQSTLIASFLTSASGIDDGTDVITTLGTAHNLDDGVAVVYSRNGGTQDIGPEPGTYYINKLTATTLSLHPTVADAFANTNKIALTVAGAETHTLDPVRYVPASATGSIGPSNFESQITMLTDSIATG